jgi:hypothetical protein
MIHSVTHDPLVPRGQARAGLGKLGALGVRPWLQALSPGRIVLVTVLFLSFLPGIAGPDIDLDSSWRLMLGYAFDHHLQFGKDFIFTYGPLGFLLTNVYDGRHLAIQLGWNVCFAGGFAWVFVSVIGRFSRPRQIVAYVFLLLVVGAREKEDIFVFVELLAAFSLLRTSQPRRPLAMVTTLFLAAISLMKFTFGVFAVVAVAAAIIQARRDRRRRDAALLGGTYLAGILGLWVGSGQNLLNLPAYVFNSIEITRGYAETMGLPTPGSALPLGIISVGCLLLYASAVVWNVFDRRRAWLQAGVFVSATFMTWKHGFVRSDGHLIYFFDYAMFCGIFSPLLLEGRGGGDFGSRLAAGAAAAAAFAGLAVVFPLQVAYALESLNTALRQRLAEIVRPAHYHQALRQGWESAAEKNALDRTRALVGRQTVDVLSFFQGVAILNGFNFKPRPVPQGYTAYTPRLAGLNAARYESTDAPEWVLQRTETIDGRLPTLDDADLLPVLLRNYEFRGEDGPYLLWRRCSPDNRYDSFRPKPGARKTGRVDQSISLDGLADRNVWAHLRVQPTLLGRLRSCFYKPAELALEITDNSGHSETFRLNPEIAASGFLLNPLLRDQFDWMRFLQGQTCVRARAVTVRVAESSRRYFRREIAYEFESLPEAPHRQSEKDAFALAGDGRFRNLPVSFSSAAPLESAIIGGGKAILIPAPYEMTYNVGDGATMLRAQYGIADRPSPGEAHPPGVKVVVAWTDLAGSRILFERKLDPARNPADGGLQELTVDLRGLGPGVLTIKGLGANTGESTATVWRDVEILPSGVIGHDGKPMLTASNNVLVRYGRFANVPLSVRTGAPVIAVVVNGLPMVQAHPDSEIALLIPANSKRAVGRFALHERAYADGGSTDGAGFSVVWKSGRDERVLFHRFLDPLRIGTDRGLQRFDVDLSSLPEGGLLLLRTDPGPAGDRSWDWSCWSDVSVGNPQPLDKMEFLAAARAWAALMPDSSSAVIPASLFKNAGGFATMPSLVSALNPPGPASIGDYSAVQVHPPSDMIVPLGDNPARLRAKFGMQRAAQDLTDGVDYEIEWRGPGGQKRMLYQRSLQPAKSPEDRLVQQVDLPLTGLSGGELHFRIGCGPRNDPSYDWACWQGLDVDGAIPNSGVQGVPFEKSRAPSAAPVPATK